MRATGFPHNGDFWRGVSSSIENHLGIDVHEKAPRLYEELTHSDAPDQLVIAACDQLVTEASLQLDRAAWAQLLCAP